MLGPLTRGEFPAGPAKRINVLGTTGSGKTTLARAISVRFAIQHIELDAFNWGPNWSEAPVEVFRERTAQAVCGEAWCLDGNYSRVRDLVWDRANVVVWLDFPLRVILWRLTKRTFARTFGQVELWNGNRERFMTQFFSRDSLYLWVLQTHSRRRREYPILLSQNTQFAVVHLQSAKAVQHWLSSLAG